MVLEFFESQAEQRKTTSLEQFLQKMRDLIKLDGRPLLSDSYVGEISMTSAQKKASHEVAVYKERKRLERENEGELAVGKLLKQARQLADVKRARRQSGTRSGKVVKPTD